MFSLRGLRLYFPALEPWVEPSVSRPRHSSWFICARMWGRRVCQPPPLGSASCSLACRVPRSAASLGPPAAALPRVLSPSCPSPPLLQVWMNVSSLSSWLLDFHTVQFSGSSACFLFLNCCCPSFGCARSHSVSTYASIFAVSLWYCILLCIGHTFLPKFLREK